MSAAAALLVRARVRLEELTARAAKLAEAEAARSADAAKTTEAAEAAKVAKVAKTTEEAGGGGAAPAAEAAEAAENADGAASTKNTRSAGSADSAGSTGAPRTGPPGAGGPAAPPPAAQDSAAGPAVVQAFAVRPAAPPGLTARPAAEGVPGAAVAETSGTEETEGTEGAGGTAGQARQAVTRQAAEVRRLQGERDRLQREAEAARGAADRLADDRETARERFRVARDRLRYGGYRAAAMSRLRARALVARGARAPSWALDKSSGSGRGDMAADWALTQIDKPYVWAGSGPRSYDCSGLTMRAWARAGVKMPHWTGTQWTSGRHVRLGRLRRGDLLFFGRRTRNPHDIRHVGLYIGRGLMVHAPRTGDVVRVAPMWRGDLIGATRPA